MSDSPIFRCHITIFLRLIGALQFAIGDLNGSRHRCSINRNVSQVDTLLRKKFGLIGLIVSFDLCLGD